MPTPSSFVLVTGATGKQGGAVLRHLLASETPVRALVQDTRSPEAATLTELGAEVARGDLDDATSLKAALEGVRAVFSMQTPDFTNPMGDTEVQRARNLAEAARATGVEQVVHSSVSGAGTVDTDDFDEIRWGVFVRHYYRSKAAGEEAVRAAGFPQYTILRPATFMENFARPSIYFADMTSDRLLVGADLDVPIPFTTVNDIGAAAAAAFTDPRRFHGVELELAGDILSFRTAAHILSQTLAADIELPASPEHARAQGLATPLFQAQNHMTAHPAPARPEFAAQLDIPVTPFHEWTQTTLHVRPSGRTE